MPNPGLDDDKIQRIRELREKGLSYRKIADETDTSLGAISELLQEDQLEELEERLNDLEEKITEREAELKQLEEKRQEKTTRIQAEISEMGATLEDAKRIEKLREEGLDLQSVQRLTDALDAARAAGYEIGGLVTLLKDLDATERRLVEARQEQQEIEANIREGTDRAERLQQTVDRLKEEAKNWKRQAKEERAAFCKAADDAVSYAQAQRRLQELQAQARYFEAQVDEAENLREVIETLRQQRKWLEQKVETLQANLVEAEETLTENRTRIHTGLGVYHLICKPEPDYLSTVTHLQAVTATLGGLPEPIEVALSKSQLSKARDNIRAILVRELDLEQEQRKRQLELLARLQP